MKEKNVDDSAEKMPPPPLLQVLLPCWIPWYPLWTKCQWVCYQYLCQWRYLPGFSSKDCSTEVNECENNPCLHIAQWVLCWQIERLWMAVFCHKSMFDRLVSVSTLVHVLPSSYSTNIFTKQDWICDVVTYIEHTKRKTVTAMDIVYALRRQGHTLYGFGS